jgi:hypothetical protein
MLARIGVMRHEPQPSPQIQSDAKGSALGPAQLKRNQPLTIFVYVNISKPVGEINHQGIFKPGCRRNVQP